MYDKTARSVVYRALNAARIKIYKARYRKCNRAICNAALARYKACKVRAIPKWADMGAIKIFYLEAQRRGLQVDHVVPLRSLKVCGLHTQHNLQLLDISVNASKGNRTWPDC